jgi:hypothetical protein
MRKANPILIEAIMKTNVLTADDHPGTLLEVRIDAMDRYKASKRNMD